MHLDASSEAASCSALRMLLCLIVWEEEEDYADMLNMPSPHLYFKEYAYLCARTKKWKDLSSLQPRKKMLKHISSDSPASCDFYSCPYTAFINPFNL